MLAARSHWRRSHWLYAYSSCCTWWNFIESFSWLCSLKTWSMNFPEWCLRELFKSSISPGSLARITCSLPEGRYYLQFHLYWSKGLCQYLQDYHLFLWICVLPTVFIFSKQPCLCRAYRIILFQKKAEFQQIRQFLNNCTVFCCQSKCVIVTARSAKNVLFRRTFLYWFTLKTFFFKRVQ